MNTNERKQRVEALLEAHELVVEQRVDDEREMPTDEFTEGHINGLKEARNRVEEAILGHVE